MHLDVPKTGLQRLRALAFDLRSSRKPGVEEQLVQRSSLAIHAAQVLADEPACVHRHFRALDSGATQLVIASFQTCLRTTMAECKWES